MGSANGHGIKAETCLIMMGNKRPYTVRSGSSTASERRRWSRAGDGWRCQMIEAHGNIEKTVKRDHNWIVRITALNSTLNTEYRLSRKMKSLYRLIYFYHIVYCHCMYSNSSGDWPSGTAGIFPGGLVSQWAAKPAQPKQMQLWNMSAAVHKCCYKHIIRITWVHLSPCS